MHCNTYIDKSYISLEKGIANTHSNCFRSIIVMIPGEERETSHMEEN